MVNKRRDGAQSVSDDSNNLTTNIRRTAVSLAVAAALPSVMAMPMNAYAQEDAIEEIITYGTFRASLIDGTLVKAGDVTAQLAAKDLAAVPAPGRDMILIGGKAYTLVRLDPVMSGAEVALYRLHLRA